MVPYYLMTHLHANEAVDGLQVVFVLFGISGHFQFQYILFSVIL